MKVLQEIEQLQQEKIDVSKIKNNLQETVAGNVLDATQGKILKEAIELLNTDRGYLVSKKVTDANDAKENGFYLLDVGSSNSPNSSYAFTIQTIKQPSYDNRTQIAVAYYPNSIPLIYMRICVNDSWGQWLEIATTDYALTYKGVVNNDLKGSKIGTYLTNTSSVTNLPNGWSQGRHTLANLSVGNELSYDLQLLGGYYEKALAFRMGSNDTWKQVVTPTEVSNPNLLINGDFQVWQRGTSFTFDSSAGYCADRWYAAAEGSAAFTISKESDCLKMDVTRGGTTSNLRYVFEKEQLRKLVGKPVTITVDLETSSSLLVYIAAFYGPSISQKGFTVNGRTKITYTLPSFAYTEQTSNPHIQFIRLGTSGWTGTIKVYSVKMEVSSVPTSFVTRPYAEELAMCQRYYTTCTWASNALQWTYGCGNVTGTATTAWVFFPLAVSLRNLPTLGGGASTASNWTLICSGTSFNATGVSVRANGPGGVMLQFTIPSKTTLTPLIGYYNTDTMGSFDAEIY